MNDISTISTVTEQIISSCYGALITSLFVTPFDVVKIRLQLQQSSTVSKKCYVHYSCLWDEVCCCLQENCCKRCNWYKCPNQFSGTLDALRKITKYEGVSALWSGLPPTLVMSVPATVIYFTMYEQIRDLSMTTFVPPLHSSYIPMMSGALARVLTVTAISPIEFFRTKMQSKKIKYSGKFPGKQNNFDYIDSGIVICGLEMSVNYRREELKEEVGKSISELVKTRGILSLWHGYIPTLYRDVPFSAIYWSLYEQLKKLQPDPQFYHSFMFGAVSGSIAATLTLPFDVIKTQRQAELGEANILLGKSKASTFTLIFNLYKRSGVAALFTGLTPRIMKVAPSCAIMISTYEFGKSYFRKRKQKEK